ncbi:hypothetical protein [Bradyrhizobium elkanii]
MKPENVHAGHFVAAAKKTGLCTRFWRRRFN